MKPQKALHLHQDLEKVNPKSKGETYMVFEKYDGWYGYWDVGSNIMSRQMREIPSLLELSEELNRQAEVVGTQQGRFIFEILIDGVTEFKDLNGILNRKETAENAYLMVHDFIPLFTHLPFRKRYGVAKREVFLLDHHAVQLADALCIADTEEAWRFYAELIWDLDGEGVILKRLNAQYAPGKRNADILKIKMECSEEMIVTGVVKGEGKYEHTLGTLLVQDVHGAYHQVSGMSDVERDLWWKDPQKIITETVEVQFMKRLTNGSLREPRFKAIRHDKKELG